jgi:hypothetical protein
MYDLGGRTVKLLNNEVANLNLSHKIAKEALLSLKVASWFTEACIVW